MAAPRKVVRLSVAMYVRRQGRSLQLQNTVFGVTNMDFPVSFRRTPITTMASFPNATPQPRRVLVTGGAGFIGSHLCERLLEIGCDLLCVDNFFTGTRRNIEHLLDHPRFEILRHDITFPLYVEVDEIYNLACPASPVHYQWDPVQTTKTSVLGAINMLGLAKRVRGKILQASTSEVYGDPQMHPQQESYWGHVNPIGPRSCYDEGKRCAETLFFDYSRQHNLKIKVLRIFNTYGPRMQPNDGRVVSNFIVQALNNQDITIYGDGQQTRSFCFVDDLVRGIIGLMNTPDKITGPMNCGNPNEFTIRDLAEKVIAMTSSRSRIVHRPLPQDDPRQRRPDISQAQELLDWRPTVMLTEGLQRTISYFDQLLSVDGAQAFAEARPAAATTPSKVATAVGRESTPLAQRSASSQDLNQTQQF
jgi:UDP-glucuronate decarboxylase